MDDIRSVLSRLVYSCYEEMSYEDEFQNLLQDAKKILTHIDNEYVAVYYP